MSKKSKGGTKGGHLKVGKTSSHGRCESQMTAGMSAGCKGEDGSWPVVGKKGKA